MRNNFWNKKIPTVAALFVIIVSIWVTSYLVKSGIITIGRATSDVAPENVKITDITDTSFVVSFTTQEQTNAAVYYGQTEEVGSIAYDERVKSPDAKEKYYSHRILVNNLNPSTKYHFSIISAGNTFLDNNAKFATTTGFPIAPKQVNQNPIYGKVILVNGLSAHDSLVYVNISGASPVSALTKDSGEFMIPFDFVRKQNLGQYYEFSDSSLIDLEIVRRDLKTQIKTTYKNAASIPTVTLSKDYDFTTDTLFILTPTPISSGELTVPVVSVKPGEVTIISPQENQLLIDTRPVFRGSAQPGAKVKIIINSPTVETEITADKNGVWTFRPATGLSPGEHTIIIESADAFGIVRKITQKFTVFAQGSQVIQPATPSATPRFSPTPTRTPSPSSTPTIKPIATATPKTTPPVGGVPTSTPTRTPPTPTSLSTLSPTPTGGIATGTPTLTTTPTKAAGLTATLPLTGTPLAPGDSTSAVFFTSFSLLLILFGLIILFVV